ncbi:MAG: hypothetical protein A3J76_02510 [Candidatus Moranbacteria bacterium RBG_13_45_13]|nr:MAG: hypothetical protein A3J76_02510 [Candidatus Moranbacteria bacterium RBG_13_45_13]
MHANVPQYIDVEDKIAFGLTAKQLLWLGAMLAVLIAAYAIFDRQLFFVAAVFVIIVFGSLAFFRPQGVTLITFLGYVLFFFAKPRSYVWRRIFRASSIDIKKAHEVQREKMEVSRPKKKLPPQSQLKRIAWVLDTRK